MRHPDEALILSLLGLLVASWALGFNIWARRRIRQNAGKSGNPYFGKPWGTFCDTLPRTVRPVWRRCFSCGTRIGWRDSGQLIPYSGGSQGKPGYFPWHRECRLREVVGSPDHLDGKCFCDGGQIAGEQTPAEKRAEAREVARRIAGGQF